MDASAPDTLSPVLIYQLGSPSARTDGMTIAELEAEGFVRCSDPSPWGSVWMVKEESADD